MVSKKDSAVQKKVDVQRNNGFTLIEILVVIGLIAILATVVLVAINPARQFAQGRDAERTSNVNAILNAIGQRIADNKGVFAGLNAANNQTCNPLPTAASSTILTSSGTGEEELGCLVPTYIPSLPFDPQTGSGASTGYYVRQDTNGRVWVGTTVTEPTIPRLGDIYVVR